MLRNVSEVDTSSTLFGEKVSISFASVASTNTVQVSMPMGFGPTAMQRLAHFEGETATSRAAANMGISMCLSSYANTSLEDVKLQGNGNPYMMQICIVKDRNVTLQLLKRANGMSIDSRISSY